MQGDPFFTRQPENYYSDPWEDSFIVETDPIVRQIGTDSIGVFGFELNGQITGRHVEDFIMNEVKFDAGEKTNRDEDLPFGCYLDLSDAFWDI